MSATDVSALPSLRENNTIPLITINGYPYPVKEALRRSMYQSENKFTDVCIAEILLCEYAVENKIMNSVEELQIAIEEMRYQKGLESKEKFLHWMRSNGQNLLSIQNELNYQLLRNKVKASLPYEKIETYFAEFQLEFDRAELYSIRVDTQAKAEELLAKVEEEGENFHLLAMQHSEDENSKRKAGYVGKVTRSEVTAEIEAAVFVAQPGDIVGPVKTDKGFNLFKVAALYPATLAAEEDAIRDKLFKDLEAKLRSKAKVDYPLLAED
jgi:parvulin-like peptidyl-prolyl isomerase